tara:strand:- start:622 stop:732 length:111 start_codon:yes stop_codon:yes gene_type:complete
VEVEVLITLQEEAVLVVIEKLPELLVVIPHLLLQVV